MVVCDLAEECWLQKACGHFKKFAPLTYFITEIIIVLLIVWQDLFFLSFKKEKDIVSNVLTVSHST